MALFYRWGKVCVLELETDGWLDEDEEERQRWLTARIDEVEWSEDVTEQTPRERRTV
jgi:hypothetical protein